MGINYIMVKNYKGYTLEVNIAQIIGAFGTLAGVFAVVKYQTGESKRHIEALFAKIDSHSETLVELRTKQEAGITAKEVSEHYLSKEHFRQFEKHIDDKFRTVIDGQGKILDEIRGLKK